MNCGSVSAGSARLIAIICVPMPTLVIGTSCVIGSKLSFCNCGVSTIIEEAANSSKYPSGAAAATCPVPSAPPAPGRFSTTKLWPNLADKCCAASRAIMSVLPPAPNGTTMVTGLEGQSAAAIDPDNRAIAARPERTTSSLSARCISFPVELREASRTSDRLARSANPGPYTNKTVVISSSGSCRSFAYTWEEYHEDDRPRRDDDALARCHHHDSDAPIPNGQHGLREEELQLCRMGEGALLRGRDREKRGKDHLPGRGRSGR